VTMEITSTKMGIIETNKNSFYYSCTSFCTIETGFTCANATVPNTCSETCGDGRNMGFLSCDDGNTKAGDGLVK